MMLMASIVIGTSVGACIIATKWMLLPVSTLRLAVEKTFESVGLTVVFLVTNVMLAVAVILSLRVFAGIFLSVYITGDIVWVFLSLLQALAFQWWRSLARQNARRDCASHERQMG